MNEAELQTDPLPRAIRWLMQHAGFPQRRLESRAELMVLATAAVAAEEEGAGGGQRFLIERRDVARDSALRAHQIRRSRVHYKCDNSAKV